MFNPIRKLRKLQNDRKGLAMVAVALIVGLVALGIVIPIGMWISSITFGIIDNVDLGESGNATRVQLENNIWAAYNLSTILPIIAVAGIIIMAVLGLVVYKKGGFS
jgi:Flp pilus assembly pilin Flp